MKTPYGIIIMDGFGISEVKEHNAVEMANKPFLDEMFKKYPTTLIGASGLSVGLPDGQMGNSEVGHLNIGGGRIVYQDFTRISKAIDDGDFYKNEVILGAIANAVENGKKLHIWGLMSDGGVHSHLTHLYALLETCKRNGLKEVYIHAFLDGRDTPPKSGADFLRQVEEKIAEIGVGTIATVHGRYYAMDRDTNWNRVIKAYDALTQGVGVKATDAVKAVEQSYAGGVTDEFVIPTVIEKDGKPIATVEKGDSVIFFNFRPDRAREITAAFIKNDFDGFERATGFLNPYYVGFTKYDANFANYGIRTAFPPESKENTLGEYLAKIGKTQLRIAETEKYAHVTFFFNGGVEKENEGETRVLIPSPKVATYDLQPEMSEPAVADRAVAEIESGKYDVIILNFANCDMVGHTGVEDAAVKAVEAVDKGVEKVVGAILKMGGKCIVTADHGNADRMKAEDGSPFTAHTTNPVPMTVIGAGDVKLAEGGILADVVPTLLHLMNVEQPKEMTGKNLIIG